MVTPSWRARADASLFIGGCSLFFTFGQNRGVGGLTYLRNLFLVFHFFGLGLSVCSRNSASSKSVSRSLRRATWMLAKAIFGSNSVRLPRPILGSRSGAIRSSIHSTGPTPMWCCAPAMHGSSRRPNVRSRRCWSECGGHNQGAPEPRPLTAKQGFESHSSDRVANAICVWWQPDRRALSTGRLAAHCFDRSVGRCFFSPASRRRRSRPECLTFLKPNTAPALRPSNPDRREHQTRHT